MDYIITSHSIIYRTYLVKDVDSIEGALDKYYEECFSLPIFPELSNKEQSYVVSLIFEVLASEAL